MITLFQNDYETTLKINIQSKERPVVLVGSKVYFELISKKRNEKIGGGECKIEDAGRGVVRYKFNAGELQVPGEYQGKVTIQLAQGAERDSLVLEIVIIGEEQKENEKTEGNTDSQPS